MSEYDSTANAYYAGNKDAAGEPSIINRITNGKVLSASVAKTKTPESLRMYNYGEAVNVTVYFDWETGATVWVNGVKVSLFSQLFQIIVFLPASFPRSLFSNI